MIADVDSLTRILSKGVQRMENPPSLFSLGFLLLGVLWVKEVKDGMGSRFLWF